MLVVRLWVCAQEVGATALVVASEGGHDAVVRSLLLSGAAVNQGRTVSGLGVQTFVMRVFQWATVARVRSL